MEEEERGGDLTESVKGMKICLPLFSSLRLWSVSLQARYRAMASLSCACDSVRRSSSSSTEDLRPSSCFRLRVVMSMGRPAPEEEEEEEEDIVLSKRSNRQKEKVDHIILPFPSTLLLIINLLQPPPSATSICHINHLQQPKEIKRSEEIR